jgi:hypothetical protein
MDSEMLVKLKRHRGEAHYWFRGADCSGCSEGAHYVCVSWLICKDSFSDENIFTVVDKIGPAWFYWMTGI